MGRKNILKEILEFVKEKHEGQVRRNGEPYYYHLQRVQKLVKDSGYDVLYQGVALLHDVLEDTNTTEDELYSLYDMQAVDCVKILTRTTKNEKKYVDNILDYEVTAVVKSADKIDNMISAGLIARDPKHRKWAINYIKKAEKYYKNRFCKAVDDSIDLAKELINNDLDYDEAIKKIGKIKY